MRSFCFSSSLLLSSNFCSNVLSLTSSFTPHNLQTQTTSSLIQNQINQKAEMDYEFDLQEHNSDAIPDLFASETDHMPSQNFPSSSKHTGFYYTFRLEAISMFLQFQYSCNLDPFIPYLAINYLDRFISKRDIPQGKPWVSRLVKVSCLSLAAKMKNTPFSSSDFQRGEGFVFDVQTVRKMELLILNTLDWRMRSITPFSFLHFFLSSLDLNDRPFTQALKNRASDIIFNAHAEIKFVGFKPSIIAASAVLSACHELLPLKFPFLKVSLSSFQNVNKESLLKCFNFMQEMVKSERLDTMSCTRTPVSVLERRLTRSEGEKTISTAATSTSTTTYTSVSMAAEKRHSKRRRLNGTFCSENMFKLSHHVQQC
ncbi:cyclin-D6-1 [Pyrus ussuriensis x Pyrus communis]|uniref:B-like cyclin n=1 Tax=Pyrus ussuriensis x Pyrus communis TaxID=2448454 RepID=A0A5N5ICF4_9ROSA|nr:putative cyclin-D6-1 [Pyrus x bretschneideri]KAB2637468.1 cyclin-D6-1 [Pyrus ussuriensis x Pyrus communis]